MMLEQHINDYWNGRSCSYSSTIKAEMNSFKKQAWQEIIKRFVGDEKSIKVLDVGTGPGFFAIIIAEMGYEVTGMDCAENMLQEARKNSQIYNQEIGFVNGDVLKIPFPDNSFDLVISRNLVWTLPFPDRVYKEWYRVLEKRGKVLIFDANWYYRLADSTHMKRYNHFRSLAKKMGYEDSVNLEKRLESERIARQLPLTYELRPYWDERILSACGFKNIQIDEDITPLVYDKREKNVLGYAPLFAVCAQKAL